MTYFIPLKLSSTPRKETMRALGAGILFQPTHAMNCKSGAVLKSLDYSATSPTQ